MDNGELTTLLNNFCSHAHVIKQMATHTETEISTRRRDRIAVAAEITAAQCRRITSSYHSLTHSQLLLSFAKMISMPVLTAWHCSSQSHFPHAPG